MEQADGGPRAETLGYYRSHVRWILDPDKTEHPLGAYQLRHVRPVIIQAALDSAGVSADMRKKIRSVLIRAFNLAVFHEAINGNPASAVPSVPVPRNKKKPVSVEDLDAVRAAIREWANAEKRNGPKSVDLPDIVEMLIATGMRIGELLALRWSDIELTPPPERRDRDGWFPWLMVNGQITSKGKRVDYGKTHAAIRPIALPDWAAALLRRRKVAQPPTPSTQCSSPATTPGTSPPTSRAGCGISATSPTTQTSPPSRMSHPTPSAERWPPRSTRSTTPRPP
jgi:integrase